MNNLIRNTKAILVVSLLFSTKIILGQLQLNRHFAPTYFQGTNSAIEAKEFNLSILYCRQLEEFINNRIYNLDLSYSPKPGVNFDFIYKKDKKGESVGGTIGIYSTSNHQFLADSRKIINKITVYSSIGYSLTNSKYKYYSYEHLNVESTHFFSHDYSLLAGMRIHRKHWGFQLTQSATLQDFYQIKVNSTTKGSTTDPVHSITEGGFPIIMTTNFQFNIGRRNLKFFLGYQANRYINNKALSKNNGQYSTKFYTGLNYKFSLAKS